MLYGMTNFVSPLSIAKEACLEKLETYPLDQFMAEERAELVEIKKSYVEPIEQVTAISQLDGIIASFEAELAKYPTRDDEINNYVEAIQETIDEVHSNKDKEKARELVEQFKVDASKADKKDDIYNLYATLRSTITTRFKTKAQVKKEKEEKEYLYGTWYIPGSNDYPFTLNKDKTFVMDVEYEETTTGFFGIKRTTLYQGQLYGYWEQKEGQVLIYIYENTLDENYEPFTWVFDYNTVDRTLDGTGDYFGYVYHKMKN